ncbi:MAG: hypothetical protein M1835_004809 [Candelina submexicana]|nr:MAG: hypothetical protein M1835_004809 [Candelina submexicana]
MASSFDGSLCHPPSLVQEVSLIDTALPNHQRITGSFDVLRFDSAESFQPPSPHKENYGYAKNGPSENLLAVSPYFGRSHLLDLATVSKPNQLLAKALTNLRTVRHDYATAPYVNSFNWQFVVGLLRSLAEAEGYQWLRESFYIIVFRSQVPPTTDRSHLASLDEKAHEEAMESGGLLKYFFGVPDTAGRNLATCVWRDRDDAKRGGAGEGHRQAMRATAGLYTEWKVERLRLNIEKGAYEWSIVEWVD